MQHFVRPGLIALTVLVPVCAGFSAGLAVYTCFHDHDVVLTGYFLIMASIFAAITLLIGEALRLTQAPYSPPPDKDRLQAPDRRVLFVCV